MSKITLGVVDSNLGCFKPFNKCMHVKVFLPSFTVDCNILNINHTTLQAVYNVISQSLKGTCCSLHPKGHGGTII